jgi:hypothetical protein
MIVYVVTNPELGWDCVCGVFESREDDVEFCSIIESEFIDDWKEEDSAYVIHDQRFHRNKRMVRDQKIEQVLNNNNDNT